MNENELEDDKLAEVIENEEDGSEYDFDKSSGFISNRIENKDEGNHNFETGEKEKTPKNETNTEKSN